jgi:hypothetical protein
LKKVSIFYYAPALCFLADAPEGYVLMGGNSLAAAPQYDLSLVQNDLLSAEPRAVEMQEPHPFSGGGFKFRIFRIFEGTNWGLYGVLGLVTLVMIALVGRLFPAIKKKD